MVIFDYLFRVDTGGNFYFKNRRNFLLLYRVNQKDLCCSRTDPD